MQIGTQKLWTKANGHTYQTHCKNGHEFTEETTYISPKSQKRTCRICNTTRVKARWQENLEENRRLSTERMRQWRGENRERHNRNWTELRARKKAWIDTYKREHPCIQCGERHIACLDFHHRDPAQKEFVIALAIARASLERIQMEVAKCDILCANCHRKLHWKERSVEEAK